MISTSAELKLKKLRKLTLVEDNFSLEDMPFIDRYGELIIAFEDEQSILNKFRVIRLIIEKDEAI